MNLQQFQAKLCWTVAGFLIHNHKVLLVKHKKLGFWLAPGGHVEENELPHQAAEREFLEETGVKTRAVGFILDAGNDSENLPNPILTNLHWVSKTNYERRTKEARQTQGDQPTEYKKESHWQKGCEQHICCMYIMAPVAGVEFTQDAEETDGIAWYSLEEITTLDTTQDIKSQITYAFSL